MSRRNRWARNHGLRGNQLRIFQRRFGFTASSELRQGIINLAPVRRRQSPSPEPKPRRLSQSRERTWREIGRRRADRIGTPPKSPNSGDSESPAETTALAREAIGAPPSRHTPAHTIHTATGLCGSGIATVGGQVSGDAASPSSAQLRICWRVVADKGLKRNLPSSPSHPATRVHRDSNSLVIRQRKRELNVPYFVDGPERVKGKPPVRNVQHDGVVVWLELNAQDLSATFRGDWRRSG